MLKLIEDLPDNVLGESAEGKITGTDYETVLIPAIEGMMHFSAWDRIALVSDHEMINTFAKFFGHMLSCELRLFKTDEFEEAKKWIV